MPFAKIKGREQAKALYIRGLTPMEIGKELSLKVVTVRQWAARYRWSRQREAIDTLSDNSTTAIQSFVADRFVARILKQADKVLSGIELAHVPKKIRDIKDMAIALASISQTGRKNLGLDEDSGPRSVSITILAEDAKKARIIDSDAQVQVQTAQPTPLEPPNDQA